MIGLTVGLSYGIFAIVADFKEWDLPLPLTNTWWTYLWNTLVPPVSMFIASKVIDKVVGPVKEEELVGLVYARHEDTEYICELMGRRLKVLEGTWLQKTLLKVPIRPEYPFPVPSSGLPWFKRPGLWACAYLATAAFLLFVVLW